MRSKIDHWIELRGYKKKWVAKQIGVSQNTLSRWINDGGKPGLEKAFELADLLRCKVDDLYERSENMYIVYKGGKAVGSYRKLEDAQKRAMEVSGKIKYEWRA